VIRTVIAGATGRMGRQLLQLLPEFPQLKLSGAVAAPGSVELGRDALELAGLAPGGVFVSAELGTLLGEAELVLDFSSAAVTAAHLRACVGARVPLLLGTTGWPASFEQEIADAAKVIPLLVAANTSRGINVLLELVRQAAAALPAEYDIEISETHHRHKLDAPSGTALALAQAAAAGRGQGGAAALAGSRLGASTPRQAGQIGLAVLRGGDVVGEHEVRFMGDGEQLRLGHTATDRSIFARGALEAGAWLAAQTPGRYRMQDCFIK
jgi:4-hydroxy-tetrahydrodipicolinate reductase